MATAGNNSLFLSRLLLLLLAQVVATAAADWDGNKAFKLIAEKDKLDEAAGDLYKSMCASEYPPLAPSNWEAEEDGKDPPPTLRALDGLSRPLVPGWVPLEQGPAQVAVATYVATTDAPVIQGVAMAAVA